MMPAGLNIDLKYAAGKNYNIVKSMAKTEC